MANVGGCLPLRLSCASGSALAGLDLFANLGVVVLLGGCVGGDCRLAATFVWNVEIGCDLVLGRLPSLLLGCRVGIGAPYIACLSSRLFGPDRYSGVCRLVMLGSSVSLLTSVEVGSLGVGALVSGGCLSAGVGAGPGVACVQVGWLLSLLRWASRLLVRNWGDLGDMLG